VRLAGDDVGASALLVLAWAAFHKNEMRGCRAKADYSFQSGTHGRRSGIGPPTPLFSGLAEPTVRLLTKTDQLLLECKS
jgi:hypothetical protein